MTLNEARAKAAATRRNRAHDLVIVINEYLEYTRGRANAYDLITYDDYMRDEECGEFYDFAEVV